LHVLDLCSALTCTFYEARQTGAHLGPYRRRPFSFPRTQSTKPRLRLSVLPRLVLASSALPPPTGPSAANSCAHEALLLHVRLPVNTSQSHSHRSHGRPEMSGSIFPNYPFPSLCHHGWNSSFTPLPHTRPGFIIHLVGCLLFQVGSF
jgi:hypothetical protein